MSFNTCDLCDANENRIAEGSLRVMAPIFRSFGKAVAFSGPAVTLKVFEDNALVRSTLEEKGEGRVLVVDGGASLRCALVGGNLGMLAEKNGWAGVIVNGCVRDSAELEVCHVGFRALATCPVKSAKQNVGERDVMVQFAGVIVRPGDWVYADADGILVSTQSLS